LPDPIGFSRKKPARTELFQQRLGWGDEFQYIARVEPGKAGMVIRAIGDFFVALLTKKSA
jgi:hypothetical protein